MKKILWAPMVFLIMLLAEPALACSQDSTENFTGGACSINELNNLEKNKRASENTNINPKGEIDLRPLKVSPDKSNLDDNKCLFGTCLYKTLLGK